MPELLGPMSDDVLDIPTTKKGDLSIGDIVMMDTERCKVVGFGTKEDSVIVKPVESASVGRRLTVAVVRREGLKKL